MPELRGFPALYRAENPNVPISGYLFSMNMEQYLARKPLIVTTNLSLGDLKHPRDTQEHRIFDRVLEMCVPVCFDGESLRKEKAKGRMQLYKQLTNL